MVEDIEKSIRENGLEYYIDRLLQDSRGDYFFVETEPADGDFSVEPPHREGWRAVKYSPISGNEYIAVAWFYYRIVPVSRQLAWFCIDALKLKSQVIDIGNGEYDGPHGGEMKAYYKKDGEWVDLTYDLKMVRVEKL